MRTDTGQPGGWELGGGTQTRTGEERGREVGVASSPQWGRPCSPCSGPGRLGNARGPRRVGRGAHLGPGGAREARLRRRWPTCRAPGAGASLPAEAPGRLEERASRPRSHAPQLRARLSQTNRGGDRVAPTRICDPSRRRAPKTSIQPGRRPSAAGAEGSSGAPEAGGAAAASTARPRSGCCAGRAGCAWGNFGSQCWLPGESSEGAARGSAATVHRAQGAQAWEPAPPAHPDTAGPRAAPVEGPRASGALHGLSPAIPGFAAARAWTLRDAGFVSSASPRWRTAAAALAAGCLGRWGRGLAARVGAAAGACGSEGGTWRASPQVPRRRAGGGAAARGGRAGGCGAAGIPRLDEWEPHRGGQLGLGASRARTALAPKPWISLPESRVQRCTCPGMGATAAPSGRVLREGSAGTQPQRLCAEPLFVDGGRLSLPA